MTKIAEVIPVKKMPRKHNFFDYLIPGRLEQSIKPGRAVIIPFRGKSIVGLVKLIKSKTEYPNLKEISGLSYDLAGDYCWQLEFADWFSKYYYCSSATVLSLMFPDLLSRRGNKENIINEAAEAHCVNKKTSIKTSGAADEIVNLKNGNFLLFPFNLLQQKKLLIDICRQCVELKRQVLILWPTVRQVEDFYRQLPEEIIQAAAIVSSSGYRSKTQNFKQWQAISRAEKFIVVGARSAVFSPFLNLRAIFVGDAHSDDYKQWDQNPRYEAIAAARKLQNIFGCSLALSSVSPRIEDAYAAKSEKCKLVSLGRPYDKEIRIVDLNEERKRGAGCLGGGLVAEINDALKKNEGKILLLVNRKGEANYFYCADCFYEALCPECGLPFSVLKDQLVCFRCRKQKAIEITCPACGGVNFKKTGAGKEKVEMEIKKIFGDEKRIIIDTAPRPALGSGRKLLLIAVVYADSLVYLSDFNSTFKLFSYLEEAVQLANSQAEPPKIIVQTFFPENPAFARLNFGYKGFFQQEIENRFAFGYPPKSVLIKLIFQHRDLKTAQAESFELYKKLRPIVSKNGGRIFEPYLYYARKVRSRFRYQIAVFLPRLSIDKENNILNEVPDYWIIDKNPLNLL